MLDNVKLQDRFGLAFKGAYPANAVAVLCKQK